MALTGPAYYGNKYLEDIAREQNIGAVYGYLIDDTDNSISKISGNQVLEKYMPGDEAYQATVRTNLDSAARGTFQEYLDTYFPGGTLREDLQAPRPKITQAQADIEQANRDAYMEQQQENRQEGPQVKRYSDKDLSSMRASGELTPGGTKKDYLRSIGQDKQSKEAARKAALPSARLAAKKAAEQGAGGSSGNLDVITDPVTGQMFSRDLSIPGSTYQPYAGDPAYNPSSTIAPDNQSYSDKPQAPSLSVEDIISSYGFNVSPTAPYQFKVAPAASWKEIYTGVLDTLGRNNTYRQREKVIKEMGKLDQELADKIADVNENPWLSEGVRVSQIRKLEERYDLKRAPHAANLTTLENLWNDQTEEARWVATQTLQQYNQDREFQLDQIQFMQDQAEKQMDAAIKLYELSNKEADYGPGVIGEYQFAVSQGYQGSFIDYANEDANRKRQNINVGGSGLTPYQENQTFITLTNKYQADPIVNAGIKGQTAVSIADQVIADPKNAANQLKALYTLVKNLDPDSAVREGEVTLADKTQSYLQTFENSLARITQGRVIAPDAAVALATATKELAQAWADSAARRQRQYQAQAQVGNVGGQFNQYLGAFDSGFTGGESSGDPNDPLGIR